MIIELFNKITVLFVGSYHAVYNKEHVIKLCELLIFLKKITMSEEVADKCAPKPISRRLYISFLFIAWLGCHSGKLTKIFSSLSVF